MLDRVHWQVDTAAHHLYLSKPNGFFSMDMKTNGFQMKDVRFSKIKSVDDAGAVNHNPDLAA